MPTRTRDGADRLEAWGRRLQERVRRARMLVVLLGAGGAGLEGRRRAAARLRAGGILAVIPEDDVPPEVSPSVAEPAAFPADDVDLVFLSVESWGSATELGQFHGDPRIARKLRVLVPPEHHPFYGAGPGYLTDLYLTHLAAFGHVYAVDDGRKVPVPAAAGVVVALAERYRQIKALNPTLIK